MTFAIFSICENIIFIIGGNSINWIYNNKPYLGLTIGIANF
jgi:hypothetical protein